MLSRRGLPASTPLTAADPDDSGSCLGVAGAGVGTGAGEALAAAAAGGFGFSAGGSAFVPGLDMLPLQFDFIPSVPSTHLSTIAPAFFLETNPNLREGKQTSSLALAF